MDGKIDAIIDGGPVGIGLESTIVDVTEEMPMVLRPGAITVEMLRETVGEVGIDPAILGPVSADVRPKAPGMKYRHYAPKADLTLVEGETEAVVETINRLAGEKLAEGRKVGIICTDETKDRYPAGASGDCCTQPVCSSAGFRRSRRGIYLFGRIFGRQFRTGDYEPAQ